MRYFLISIATYILSGMFAAGTTFAQEGETSSTGGSGETQFTGGSNKSDFGDFGSTQLKNPLGSQTLIGFFNSILDVIIVFAVPIIVFFIIFAGFKFVMARGKPEEIETAKKALLYAVIGGVIILGAKILLVVIQGTVEALRV